MAKIFVEGINLTDLKIRCWTTGEGIEGERNPIIEKINMAVLIASCLPRQTIEKILLEDYSLTSRAFNIVETLAAVATLASYSVIWEDKERTYPRVGKTAVLTITKNLESLD
jgi:hypothetical protein